MLNVRQLRFNDALFGCSSPEGTDVVGLWAGNGARHLSADGQIHANTFVDYLHQLRPTIGVATCAFEILQSAPLSVAALWATRPESATGIILQEAMSVSGAETLEDFERHALSTPRGVNNVASIDVADGVIAAVFPHTMTDDLQPDPHIHVIVINLVKGTDRRWGNLDPVALLQHGEAASELHTLQLILYIEEHTGMRFAQTRSIENGQVGWELRGVPSRLLRRFASGRSTRSGAITR